MADVARRHIGPSPKSLDWDQNLSPNIHYFVTIFRFVAIYKLFGNLWTKTVFLRVKNSVSWARSALLHGIYFILYIVKFPNLQLRAKTLHLSRNSKYVLDEIFCGQTATLGSVKTCSIAQFFFI